MLMRRHVLSLAAPVTAAGVRPARAPAASATGIARVLRVHVASPLLDAPFAWLAGQVAAMSDGGLGLAACGPEEAPVMRFGALAFGPGAPAPPLELFAGLPCGMAPLELGAWLLSRDGADLWSAAHALRGRRALPCAILACSGGLGSPVGVADLAALSQACRPDGILGLALRDMRMEPAAMAIQPVLAAGAGSGPQAGRLTPPFAAVIELVATEVVFGTLEHHDRAVLEQACAATFRRSMDALPARSRLCQDMTWAPAADAAAMAAHVAERLQNCLTQPEAMLLRSAERYTTARRAGLRYDAWA